MQKYCLTDTEFNAISVAIKEKESSLIKQRTAHAKEALNRLIEAKWKLYQLKC